MVKMVFKGKQGQSKKSQGEKGNISTLHLSSRKAQNKELKFLNLSLKQGQMKIQQMAIMLLAVTLFFILVGLFVLAFRLTTLRGSAAELEAKNAMLLVSKISNSPEFACGDAFGTGKLDCIDADKLMALKGNIEKYEEFWGNEIENIEIRKVYPPETDTECNAANYPDCDVIKLFDRETVGVPQWTFALLCRKAEKENGVKYDKCEISRIRIFVLDKSTA